MIVNIHKAIYRTTAEGFGIRSCIWFQGCSRHCKGCMAKATWDPCNGEEIDTKIILQKIFEKKQEIEGVTFLGGEPFEQPEALCELTGRVKEAGLSVIVFTGFTIEQLRQNKNVSVQKCLEQIDLLIDGAYEEEKRDFSRPWVGSTNQRYLFLTDRYSEKDLVSQRNRIEIRVTKDGKIQINGMTDFT